MKIFKSIWFIVIIGLFLIYTLVGFFLVPYVITDVLPEKLSKDMSIKTDVKKAKFNPFTFRLVLDEPTMYDENKKPIFSVDKFKTQLNILPIFSKNIELETIDFQSPKLYTIIDKNGELNLLTLSRTKDSNSSSKKSDWNFKINVLNIKNGNINFKDQRGEKPIDISLKPLNYQAKNLSSIKDEVSSQKLHTKSSKAKDLKWDATLSLNPFNTKGSLHVEGLDVESLVSYGLDKSGIYPKNSKLDISLDYQTNIKENGLSLHVSHINLLFNKLEIFNKQNKITALEKLSLKDFDINVNIQNTNKYIDISRGKINADGITIFNSSLTPLDAKVKNLNLSNILLRYDFNKILKGTIKNLTIDDVNFSIDKSLAPFSGNFDKFVINDTNLSLDSNSSLNLNNQHMLLDILTLQNNNLDKPSLHVKSLNLKNLMLKKDILKVGNISLESLNSNIELDKNGSLDILSGVPNSNDSNSSKSNFIFKLSSFELKNSNLSFLDNSLKKPFAQDISSINLLAKNISNIKNDKATFDLKAKDKNSLNLDLKGNLIQNPLHVEANYEIRHKKAQLIQPYLQEYANIILTKGDLNSKGKLSLNNSNILLKANVSMQNFALNTKDKKELISWKNLDFKGIDFSNKKQKLSIKNINFINPNANLIVEKNGKTNLANLTASLKQKPEKKSSKFDFSFNNFDVKNGKFNILNNSLLQKSTIKISSINANAKPFYLNRAKPTKLNLKATINKTGYLNINGKLVPKDIKIDTSINTSIKNVSIPSLNAYTQKYLGYNVKKGSLTSTITQNVKKGQLKGDSQTTLEAIELGNQVKSKDALALPLEAGLMILRDSSGDVELNVPISGDMNDPTFSYGNIVVTAIVNVFTGIVTAPFSILGNILGIDGKKLKTIDFEASKADIIPSEQEKMKQYAKILQKHPDIKLVITATYDENSDFKSDDNSTKIDKPALESLAQNRAQNIKTSLIKAGVANDKIVIEKPTSSKARQNQWIGSKISIKK